MKPKMKCLLKAHFFRSIPFSLIPHWRRWVKTLHVSVLAEEASLLFLSGSLRLDGLNILLGAVFLAARSQMYWWFGDNYGNYNIYRSSMKLSEKKLTTGCTVVCSEGFIHIMKCFILNQFMLKAEATNRSSLLHFSSQETHIHWGTASFLRS